MISKKEKDNASVWTKKFNFVKLPMVKDPVKAPVKEEDKK